MHRLAHVCALLLLAGCQASPARQTAAPSPAAPLAAPEPVIYRTTSGGAAKAGGATFFLLAPGSTNIHLEPDKKTGTIEIDGLKFNAAVVVSVSKDGTVEVDKEGLVVEAADGKKYVSRRLKLGDREAIVLVQQ